MSRPSLQRATLETVQVFRRRLFERIDEAAAEHVIEEKRALWPGQRDAVASEATKAETLTGFRDQLPAPPGRFGDLHQQDSHARQLPGDAAHSQPNRVRPLGAKTFLLAPLLLLTTGI